MISVVLLTHNSEEGLARTLASLVSAAADGVIREVVVVDRGSMDGTSAVAEAAGCLLVEQDGQWADRVSAGIAAMRRAPWILVLEPRVLLDAEWHREVSAYLERVDRAGRAIDHAVSFRLEYDAFGLKARLAERIIRLCSGAFGSPLAEQGLLFSRALWDDVQRGGRISSFSGLVARIGGRRIHVLRASAVVVETAEARTQVPGTFLLMRHALGALGIPGMRRA